MSTRTCVLLTSATLTVLFVGASRLDVHAQSPYGLAARQSIPLVIEERDDTGTPVWTTEISIHNPGLTPITVRLDVFTSLGHIGCTPQPVAANGTTQVALITACPALNPVCCAAEQGRLELNALPPLPAAADPAGLAFLAKARLSGPGGRSFTVEGFPQGTLSGNRGFAAVTGLKSGVVGGSQWRTFCVAESLNETSQVWVKLVDGGGNAVGVFPAFTPPLVSNVNPIDGFGSDIFTAVGAPAGNYDNVTALFSTAPTGGIGGPGAFAFCRIVNVTSGQSAFAIAKYLDNNDEGRQHQTDFHGAVLAETDEGDKENETSLHVAYFQHPDLVRCSVRFDPNPSLGFHSDFGQMRLLDEAGNQVAGGPDQTTFQVDLGEKSTQYSGQNRRWVIEVGPSRTIKTGGGLSLHQGGLLGRNYTLTCSSGNGHSQLDTVGFCKMACSIDKNDKDFFLCSFDRPLDPARCRY